MNDWAKQRRAELEAAAPVKRAKRELFITVPLELMEKAGKAQLTSRAVHVLILLLHMSFKAHSLTFVCPNDFMEKCGIDRYAKRRALAELETAGFVAIRRRPCRAPLVTIKL
jgi:hypothetical protein